MNPLRDFVAFDFETTGLDREADEIVEIGAVRVRDGRLEERFARLVKASKGLSPLVESLTGLTPAMLAEAVEAPGALQEFLAFADGLPLVAHNADFDSAFLQEALKRAGLPPAGNPVYDSLLLARTAWPAFESHRLEDLARVLEMPPDRAHRAVPDAERSAMLWLKAQERLAEYSPATRADLARVLADGPEPWRSLFAAEGSPQATPETPSAPAAPAPGPAAPAAQAPGAGPAEGLFADGGAVARAFASLGREFRGRAGQGRLAGLAERALEEGRFLAVEADPGTGRTLACLVAAARHGLARRRGVCYAVGSRARLERIAAAEFPALKALLGEGLRLAVLKPPSAYLSPRKYADVLADPGRRLAESERLAILPLITWREATADGDVSAAPGFNHERQKVLWPKLCADAYAGEPGSWAYAARERAARAHVVAVTQDLLLEDLALDFALLPPYEALVCDDAHRFVEAAQERLGREIGFFRLRHALQLIAWSKTEDRGLLAALEAVAAADGAPEAPGALPAGFREDLARLREKAFEPEKQLQKLFNKIGKHAAKRRKDGESRVRYAEMLVTEFSASPEGTVQALSEVEALLLSLAAALESLPAGAGPARPSGLAPDCRKAASLLRAYRADLEHLADPKPASEVYWLEEYANPHRALIRCAPRDAGSVLAERFHPQMGAAVYASSAIALADQLGFFCRQAGLDPAHLERVRTAAVRGQGSARRVAPLLLARYSPVLSGAKAMDAMADSLGRSLRAAGGPAFLLFTHVGLLKQARARLGDELGKDGRMVAAQHVDGSRESLLHLFRHRADACLLGTDAFVDGLGPGDPAPMVVGVTKLPFPVPSEPLVAAALERVQEAGENPLYDYLLPMAILRLKQELGRLPRPAQGSAAVWVLDPRLCTEKYARAYLRGLGRESAVCASEEELLALTRDLREGRWIPAPAPGAAEDRPAGQPHGKGGPRPPKGKGGGQGKPGQGGGRPPQGRGQGGQGGPKGPRGPERGPRPGGPKGPGHRPQGPQGGPAGEAGDGTAGHAGQPDGPGGYAPEGGELDAVRQEPQASDHGPEAAAVPAGDPAPAEGSPREGADDDPAAHPPQP